MDYTDYILYEYLKMPRIGITQPTHLYELLLAIPYNAQSSLDLNREGSGLDIRRRYCDAIGEWPMEGPCSMLEMIASLAYLCDSMLSYKIEDSFPYMYFVEIINNLTMNAMELHTDFDTGVSLACDYYFSTLFGRYDDTQEIGVDIWTQANHYPWSECF